jgi:hypothetical protein
MRPTIMMAQSSVIISFTQTVFMRLHTLISSAEAPIFIFLLVSYPRQGDHLEDPGVDGRIILKWIFKKWDGSIDWIDMAQDRDRWRAPVNAIMNLRGPYSAGNFLTS